MSQTSQKARFLFLCLLVILLIGLAVYGCTGTPMPIPPSVNPEKLTLEVFPEQCEFGPNCMALFGGPEATKPGSIVIVHRVSVEPEFFPGVEIVESDAMGSFSMVLAGLEEESYRMIVHGEESTDILNFRANREEDSPWPVEAIPNEDLYECLEIDTESIDFGQILSGTADASQINIRNVCDEMFHLIEVTPYTRPEGTAFGIWSDMGMPVGPQETTTIAVLFFPRNAGDYRGAILVYIEQEPVFPEMSRYISIPVRGEAVEF